MNQAKIVETAGLQWLVFPNENEQLFTDFKDGREGELNEFFVNVNGDPLIGLGHPDWRLPTADELKKLVNTDLHPKSGVFLTSSTPNWDAENFGFFVDFSLGIGLEDFKDFAFNARLVRACY